MNVGETENTHFASKEFVMKAVKIGKRHQVTIPKEIYEKLHLEEGDLLEAGQEGGRIVLTPKRLVDKAPAPKLSKNEQEILGAAKKKIARIQKDMINSQGLNTTEVRVAVKAGLIDAEQAYWWHEEWQKGEREAEESIAKGELAGPFDNINDALKALKKAEI